MTKLGVKVSETDILSSLVSCCEPHDQPLAGDTSFVKQTTEPVTLETIYSILPAKFPRLYEQLVLSYRWERSDLGLVTLLANPVGPDLTGLQNEILRDKKLSQVCLNNGFIQFGFTASGVYDPVCFDTKGAKRTDYGIVSLAHENLLCNERIKITSKLANSFDDFVIAVIKAKQRMLS